MKVLSIRQPWALLILLGIKDIENRTWRTKHRGRFLIHASKRIDRKAMEFYQRRNGLNPDDCVRGAIIGSVELIDVVEASESPWFSGPKGFVLKDPRPEKIRWTPGKLGFFELKEEA